MANKKKNMDINADRFDELLAIAGYTYPRTDKELELFESMYEGYDFELKDVRINPEEIISGSFEMKGKVIKLHDEEEQQDISEIRLAARKGSEEIPQSILDKMKSKHKDGDKQS
ncbi:hypothetical protein SAMN05421766_11155 [Zobellia uliginosa]|uniref:Uncharacterized protein n=1 Tax=Zobellia uliginosa TaxID=143224 RepID=A0ABY1L2E8_9FLAO|nr:hypothetical protein [Zobellia uliginosa]SIT12087.1 hypothetical protein SAMN05421766_11155 [Zobellia uliginosa]